MGTAKVFTIHSLMLVSMGFLLAVLLGFIVAPAYWARAVRLTTERIRRALPMTEAEIRAQLDRLRAEHAVRVHRLESQFEKARLSAARQRVEINRRDAAIGDLERQVRELDTNLEASSNARRVLEQTISDRIPKIEARLIETRKLLETRDAEINEIKAGSTNTYKALDEAMQVNKQQRNEIDRLRNTLATRTSGDRTGPPTERFNSDIALRSELEELRARARDQASLIDALQKAASANVKEAAKTSDGMAASAKAEPTDDDAAAEKTSATIIHLNEVEKTGDGARAFPTADSLNAEIDTLKTANKRQADEIEKLRASLSVYEKDAKGDAKPSLGANNLGDSKVALRASLTSAEKEIEQQAETIKRLNTELAAANDRLTREASRHREELRKLGSGTVPTTARPRGEGDVAAKFPDKPGDTKPEKRKSLASRIVEKLPETATELASTSGGPAVAKAPNAANAVPEKDTPSEPPADAASKDVAPNKPSQIASDSSGDKGKDKPSSVADKKVQRARLMDRIAGLGKS
jgi:hypothetical protein